RPAVDDLRAGHQSQDRQSSWPDDPAVSAAACGSGNRVSRSAFVTGLDGTEDDTMARRVLGALFFVAFVIVGRVLLAARGRAERTVLQNVDHRVVLAFRVNPAPRQKWLPTPWQIAPIAAGPSKDANLTISFIDRLINQDREGKLVATGTTRLAALVVPREARRERRNRAHGHPGVLCCC